MRVLIHTISTEVLQGDVDLQPGELERLEFNGTLTVTDQNTQTKYPLNLAQVVRIVRASS